MSYIKVFHAFSALDKHYTQLREPLHHIVYLNLNFYCIITPLFFSLGSNKSHKLP